ncbi:filamentous hemagglutinin N-terminal domain-containing protein [Janthinobacterium lividum]|uniref:two-partner secretion domain-containing protein n=2 Tax=Janthinobacterium TaxID=29580 RepID=UPI000451F882|nr:filamentous hemagglutinin N-terminal domain-containing protein [Janthinobacterium lividum]EZP37303.1 Polymorphic membrane protein, Filamentous hemagglutinin/Adhesin [Janthinobacterium lividum]
MNKNLYRIIFNKRRGQLMVVAENASSQGKAAKGEGGLDSGVFEGDGGGGLSLSVNGRLRPLALAIFGALGMVAFVAGPAMGQIVADPNAPGRQRPTVVQSANGVTQVNIQTPSAAGVSRNTYSQFDVTANGAILNNSRGNVQTQTGGWVQGNPWLAGGSARVILNEVNSANPSQLRGYVEVAGQRAEVVIANPAGVAIDGGGFINASRVVLTTGTPMLNDGSLDGYMVQRGVVTINGRGLDTSLSDYTAILARAAQINGGIWAQELKVVTGTNQIDAAHGLAGAASGVGPAPAYALDVAQLGGMYAGKITLIGTEAGLGVRNAGVLAATAGNLVLQSNGWLSNSGNIQSAGSGSQTSIAVTGDVANSGTVYAGGDSQVQAQGNIANSGVIGAQNNVGVQATGAGSRIDAGAGSVLAAGLNLDNTLTVSGKLSVSAGDTIAAHGTVVAGGDSSLAARQLDLAGAQVSGANVSLGASAGDLDASRAQVSARERLQLDAARTVRSDAAQLTGQQLGLNAHDLSNVGGQITQLGTGDLSLQLPGSLDNTRGVIATNSQALRLQAASLSNQDGQIQHAGTGALEIGAGQINLQRGSIISNGALALTGEQIDHRDARTVAGQLSINAGTLDNRGGSLAQSGQGATGVQVRGVLDNRGGALESNGTMTVQAAGVQNQKGRIVASGDLALSTGALDNTEATLAAGGKLRLDSGDIDNTRGQIQALAGDAALTVAKLNNTAGSVFAGGNLVTKAGEVLNSGNLYAAGSQTLQVNGAVSNSGVIAAQGDNRIDASRIDSVAGSLLGAGVRADGSLAGGGQLQLTATQAIAAHGQNLAAGKTSMHAAAIDLSGSQTGGAAITLNATAGNVVTDNALVTTTGLLSVTAAGSGQALSNVRGTLSAGQLDLNTGSLDNRSGTLIQTGNGDTTLQGSTLDNTGGRIAVNSAKLALHADKVLNRDGSIEHAGTGRLSIEAARFDDERGKVTGNGLVDIQADTIDHRHAITSGQNVTVQAGQLDNSDGTLQQTGPGQMRVDVAQTLDNTRGNLASNGELQVQAGVLDNSKGRITSAASADIASKGALNNTDGVMAATKDLQVGGVHIDNTRGVLQANMLRIDAATLLNQQGTVSAGIDLTAKVSGDLNNAGLLYAGRNQQLTVGGLLNNTGSIASVNNTNISAGKITSSGLLGAGVKADGSLGTAGDLTINADGVLQASGQNLAAGSALLTGANVDLSGSQTGAANIAITARSGDVLTNKAVISASNVLAITANANNAQSLVNGQGQLVAGQLQLNVANLNNASGEIVQTGTGDTVITTGKLDNTAGRIAVNSNNLALNATVLTNINGKLDHAGAGILAINAGQFNNQFGKITGNGKLDITAATLDHRNAMTVANQLTINAGSLDNRAGSLAQTGAGLMTVSAAGQLDNTGGKIEGNGDALVKANSLLNNTGRIVAAQDAVLNVGSLDNTEGTVAAGRHLNLSGGDVDNTKGQLQAVAGNATLNVADLNNAAGSVFAGANLNTTLDTLNNTGSLYAAGNQTLNASATITNTGVIAAQGNNNLTAKSIDSSASSLIGAGIQADGKLGTSGDLTISTAQSLAVHGQILAAGNANLSGATLDISGSQASGANIGLTATQGDVSTNKAVVTTSGTLSVATNATLHNTEGTLQAGQLDLHVANLDNAKGVVLQTGTGNTVIQTGSLDNTAGRIAVNSANLNIDAVSVTNKDGKIEHAGTGILNLQAGVLDNSKGRITSAASADIASKGALNNTDGVMAATADLHVGGVHVDNTRGVLQAENARLDAATLLNQQGTVSAGTDLTARISADLSNAGLMYAGRNQQLTVGGLLNNTGSIASVNNTNISAGKITSSGLLGAGVKADGSLGTAGDLTINADGVLQASGQNLAAGTATLTGANVDLSGSQTGASNIAITARSGDVLTNKTVISASNVLAITANANNAQSLVNSQGQLVAGQLQLNVANLNNASGEIVQTGTGDTVITTGKLDNTAGRIAVNSNNLALNATVLTNINGKLEHAGAGLLAINAGQFHNQFGKITGNGKLDITAATLDHRNAMAVANQLTINAGSLDNRSGSLAQTGTGLMTVSATGQLDNMGGKIEGNGDALVKADTLLNSTGRIVATQDAVLNVGSLDNTEGTVAAGRHLNLSGGDIDNTKGQLQAVAGNATLNVASLNNAAGSVFSGANLNTTLDTLNNTGSLYAAGNQSLTATGAITNTGVIAAQGNNNLTAKSIDNSASSLIGAGIQADGKLGTSGELTISTAQNLAAHGQILAAGNANLTGATLDISGSQASGANVGLTATQGDVSTNKAVVTTSGTLSMATKATLHNTEGTLQAGQLDLHVANLDNAKGTVLQTGTGDTTIVTGNLDNTAGRIAVNSKDLNIDAVTVTNKDGKIEHAGTGILNLQAGVLDNSKGRITSAAAADIVSKSTLNNTDGVMAATADLHVGGVNIDNTRGVLQADNLRLDAAKLLNQQGTVSAGMGLTAKVSGDLNNAGLLYAGRNQQLTVGGLLNNTGSIASVNNTTIAAGKVTSSGLLGAGVKADGSLGTAGDLIINADGVLQASGQNLAAGTATLTGANVDLSGSQTGASNIAITARSGDVLTNKAVISASNVLAITANANNGQSLVNTQGQLVAGQLQLNVANLNNASGEIVQTGVGDTVITTGKLDNTAGRIAVNSNNLALNATVLTNINGKLEHAGSGLLAINAGQFNNQFGKITGNGKLDITANTLDHRNAMTVANQLTINAGSLDNRAGSLAQTGTGLMTVNATGQLNNTGGKIEGNGDALVKAATLLNSTGRIVAAQDATLNLGSLDNTEGTVAAGRHLNLSGGDIGNIKGQLQAVAGNATLNVASLNNAAGNVFAGANLNATLASLDNTGSLYAAGNQSLTATGAITNTGVIAAQGNNNLTAKSIDSSASSLIGAGIQADGKLGTSGELTISTAQNLAAHGQILAAGNANLSGATLDISGSQASGANIGLTATQGEVSTNKAVVTTSGTLSVATNATLHNTEGTLQAGQLDLHVANLDNAKGVVLQTGTGNTVIQTGSLDNTAGRIAVNSANLNIDAVSVTNKDGKIEHAGTGILNLQAGVLDNRKGRITSAASADIASKGVLNNTDGVIAATADLHVGGVHVDNTRGILQADTLRLDTASLLNQQGTVSAGTDLTAKVSGDLNNAGLLYAGRNQQLTVGGLLNNTGSIASVNNTTITAGKVTSSGLLGAGVKADGNLGTAGDLTINADGVLQASGQNLAAGTATLTGASVDLSGSQTGASNIAITARSGDVLTNKAVISASNVLAITANATNAQSLVNTQGQLVAGQLQLNVANLNNASGEIVQTGAGDTVITTGKLDNTAGRIAANSANLALNATVLTNINGKLEHAGSGLLTINAGQFNNQYGKITGNGKLDITAVTLDHRNATTVANQLAINAGSLDNRAGSLAQTGSGLMTVSITGQLDNTGGKIEGNGDALVKAATLLNNTGRIVAAQDAVLNVGSLDNTEGTVAAGRHLQLSGGDIDNTKGQLQAVAGNATLNVANLNNTAGNVFAGANLNATLSSLDNTGSLYAAGNQSLTATGAITNTGVIAAQGNISITAKTLDSSASSLIGAGVQADGKLGTAGDLTITTAQTLVAHGQTLAAGGANLTGASVDISGSQTGAANIGLTATQGDVSTNKAVVSTPGALTIHAQATLRNTEGQLSAGQLDLHVGNLDNTKGTVIQTGTGDTVIQTGKLDNSAGRIAVNSNNLTLDAATLTNAGGKIEHAGTGTLAITAATLQGASGSIIGNGAVNLKAGLLDHANATTTGRTLSVQAESLSNRGGHLLQTGAGGVTVAVTGLLDNTNGEIAGNGVLSVQTGNLDNTKGKITSAMSANIVSTGALVNTDGVIASATDLHLGGAIDNTRGLLQAGTGALSLDAASLRNAQGTVSAGMDITAKVSGDVLNAGVLYAGRNQTLDIGGLLSNTGSLAALGNTAITAGSLSGNGLLAAGMRADGSFASAGDLAVTARGVLQAGGQNMAAGQLQLTGASVDMGGSQSSAANIGLTALTGNVTTSKAVVSTNGLLSITANAANGQALVNQGGSLSAGQLALRVANLDNTKGTLIQTGAGDTVIETGKLDNTGGRIAVNSANLRLQAGDLTNVDGKIEHAGKGVLDIRATNLYGQRGQLTGNGALGVAANYIDHRNASLLAQQVGVTAGILDNRQGQITQLGTSAATVLASTRLDNSGGKIEANGNVRVETGELLNDHGRIASAQDVNVAATGKLDNTSGVIITGRDLTLAGGKVDNTLGQLQAAGGNAQLSMDELLNAQGSIVASGNLTTTAGSVRNSGSLFAGGEQVLKVSGALENTGVILAQGNNTINANSVNSGASSLIGAGVKADGSLQTSGNLQVTAQQALGAHGQVLAAGNAVLGGGSVDLGGSRSSADNINLTATTGDVNTSGAVVTTPGALTITAGANSQTWNNQRGDISAGQLAVGVGNLNNQQGSIVQTGTGNTVIELTSPAGVLDNTGGRIAVNSANLSLKAGALTNTDGKIEHAGSGNLSLQATQLNDLRGQITGNGALVVTAGTIDHRNASTIAQQVSVTGSTLDNAGGNLMQLGKGDTSIQLTTSLDNRGGTIASNGNTNIVAPSLNNQGGKLQAAGTANLTVTANNVLDNSHGGAIAGGGNVVLGAGSLLNQGGSATAGGQLTANVAQALNNAGGLLAATGNMTVNAASVDNSAGGKLASVQGQLQVTSTGATVNNGGTMQAGGDIILGNSGLWNGQGTIAGANVTLDTRGQVFNNTQGTLAGTGTVNLQTGILDNDGGLLQSGGAMTIDTHGNALLNTNAGAYAVRHPGSAGGISSGAGLNLQTGSWNNTSGYLGAAGNITGSVGPLDNRRGQIVGKSALDLTLSGLQNQGGQIQVLGNIGLNAGGGSVNNQQGLIRSGATVTLTADAIDNASTLGANQGIEGIHVTLNSANVSNVQGAVRADGNLAINSAGSINNTLGMLSAGGALALQDTGSGRGLAVTNTGGTIIGGQRTDIRAGSLSGDGKVLSQKDMALDLAGNFTLNAGAEIMANGNADIAIGGLLTNAGKIQARSTLTLGAANFDNTSTGDINAGTTRINVGGLLNNRGVIDGINTELNVGTLNNMGTGRIYGDHLSIAGGTVNNDVEGGIAATIAARTRLDIGVTTLNNREHGLIFSGGDMAIGGYLDGNRIATGWAGSVTNASATIEALGNLDLAASQFRNLNTHFRIETLDSGTESVIEYGSLLPGEKDKRFRSEGGNVVDANGIVQKEYVIYRLTRTSRTETVVDTDPAKLLAGGNVTIRSSDARNEQSHVIAGGRLLMEGTKLVNPSVDLHTYSKETGTSENVLYVPSSAWGGYVQKPMGEQNLTPVEHSSVDPVNQIYQKTPNASPSSAGVSGVTGGTSGTSATSANVTHTAVNGTPGSVAGVNAAGGTGAGTASGTGALNGASGTGNAGQVGNVSALSGSAAAGATGAGVQMATSGIGTGRATVSADGKSADAVVAQDTQDGSGRIGNAGKTAGHGAVQGGSAGAATGSGVTSTVDSALLARDAQGGPDAVGGGSGLQGSGRLGSAGQPAGHGGVQGGSVATVGGAAGAGTVDPALLVVGTQGGPDAVRGTGGLQGSGRLGSGGQTAGHGSVQDGGVAAVGGVAGAGKVDAGLLARNTQGGPASVGGGNGLQGSERAGNAGQALSLAGVKQELAAGATGPGKATQSGMAAVNSATVTSATGGASHVAGASGTSAGRMTVIGQVALANPSGRAQVVRTTSPSTQIPNASLFRASPGPASRFLVETDPRFANYKDWTGSDYLTSKVQLDPTVTQKRLGDGFYEQRMVREQIAELTGQRFAGDYSSDDQQYRGLMDAGAAFAQTWDLRPGLALTAEQMAALTSDIVWLVEKDVTLADGSTQKVLVPQVYVRVREDDLDGAGSLLAGKEVDIRLSGDLVNSGTIAGRDVVLLNAENVSNMGGRVGADNVGIAARNDLNNIGGTISANNALQASAGRDINISTDTLEDGRYLGRVAGLYVSGDAAAGASLVLSAGRDVSIAGGIVSNAGQGGVTAISAGRDLSVDTVVATSGSGLSAKRIEQQAGEVHGDKVALIAGNDINNRGGSIVAESQLLASAGRDINLVSTTVSNASEERPGNNSTSTTIGSTAGLYVTGTEAGNALVVQAGRDVTVTGGVIANAGVNGQTSVIAGNNLTLNTVSVASTYNDIRNADNYSKQSKTGEVGSQIMGAGNVTLQAGHDLTAHAAVMEANGALGLVAGNDISLVNGFQNEVSDVASKSTKKGFWNKTTTTKHDVADTTTTIGTSLGGSSVTVQAGRDLQVTGSSILGDDATRLLAGNNITIDAATNTVYELRHLNTKKSGFMSSGGFGFTYGTNSTTVDQQRDATIQSGDARSMIGSTGGTLTIAAGNGVKISGSDIAAATDLDIIGKSVTIQPGQDNEKGKVVTKTVQDGFTLAVGGSVVSAIQTVQGMGEAMGKTSNGRVQAMAAATAALNAKSAIAQQGPSVSISLTYGHSESEQTQTTASTTHSGSILSGNNINITATGAGKDSNINILGSELNAGSTVRLGADNQVNLLAVQDTESQHTKSSSMSVSAGVSANISKSGPAFGFTGSVSASQGKQDGEGSTQLNTHVNAGQLLVINSGGDTTIKGAVANAGQVIANIQGNLNLESLQDTAKFDSKNQSVSLSGTYGVGASVNASFSQSKMHSDYASVQEQSGIKAGAGGFQITVGGNTDLKGAIISSSAVPGANSLDTGTLTQSDIKNHSVAEASSMGLSGGFSFTDPGAKKDKEGGGKEGADKLAGDKDIGKGKGPGGTDLINDGGGPNATDNLYEGSKLVAKNLLNNSSDSASSNGLTRSTVSNGVLTIRDNAQQQALTGKDGAAAIAALNRDTGVAHTAAEKQNVQELAKNAEIVQGFKNAMYGEATYYTDQTFIAANTPSKFYKLSCPSDRNACIKEPGLLVKEEITKEEAIAMKGVLAVNGIRNGMDRAAELAYQNVLLDAENKKPEVIVLMHIEQTQAGFADVLLAGYEKLLAPVLGYSAGDKELAQVLMGRQDTENLLLAHSRGAIVARNGLDIAASNGFVNPNLTLQAFGPGISNTDLYSSFGKVNTQTSSDKELYRYTYMKNDPIPVLTTMNPGNVIASMFEFINVYNTSYSAHSCYGTGAAGCATVSNPIAGDTFATKQDPGNIITFINGKLVKKEEKKTQ